MSIRKSKDYKLTAVNYYLVEDLLYLLKNKYPDVDLNKSHINRIIKDNNITLKITRIRHEPVK